MKKTRTISNLFFAVLILICTGSANAQDVYALSRNEELDVEGEKYLVTWGLQQMYLPKGVREISTKNGKAYKKDNLIAAVDKSWLRSTDPKSGRSYFYKPKSDSDVVISYTNRDSLVNFYWMAVYDTGEQVCVGRKVYVSGKLKYLSCDKFAYDQYFASFKYLGNEVRYTVPAKDDYVLKRPKK